MNTKNKMKRIILVSLIMVLISPVVAGAQKANEIKERLSRRIKERIFLILGVIALITGIILELMGYGAMVDGLIIGFGFFLIHANEKTREDIRSSADRIIEAIEKKRK
ncbi:MAG: hypothetical protein QMD22_11045 [archaeon]|nr:hypothetical protein [archaeon]